MVIKVLALNDDNHDKKYVTYGSVFNDCKEFMTECLLRSHTDNYEIKEFYICDPPAAYAHLSDDELIHIFDLLISDPESLVRYNYDLFLERTKLFTEVWENGDTWNYA